ncbi:MAG: hypothetical protein ABR911_07770 [Syntrophales bacterium]
MKNQTKLIVANLGRVSILLDELETLPEYYGCTTSIRESQIIIQQAIKCLSKEVYNSAAPIRVVDTVKFLAELFGLLERLKNYFNFCKQPFFAWI